MESKDDLGVSPLNKNPRKKQESKQSWDTKEVADIGLKVIKVKV